MSGEPSSLAKWAAGQLGMTDQKFRLMPLAGDASFRRYYRVSIPAKEYIAVYAPPKTEDNRSFIKIQELLARNDIRVPKIKAKDLDLGYLLIEDLGDILLFDRLFNQEYFENAFQILLSFARVDMSKVTLPVYGAQLLETELNLFTYWFLERLLGMKLGGDDVSIIKSVFRLLIDSALEQPQVFTHRDFHSRNLMCLRSGSCAVIDFQDAVVGPITYDFVSLAKDCYVYRSRTQIENLFANFLKNLIQCNLVEETIDESTMRRWVDLMGLQRHLKVLGVFSRLDLRDKKPSYLIHLPLVLHYVVRVISHYRKFDPAILEFHEWFDHSVWPNITNQSWMIAS